MKKANKTSFKKGYKRSPESIERQRQTMIRQIKNGKRIPPKPKWTDESKALMVKRNRATKLKKTPIGSIRKTIRNGTTYAEIKVSDRGRWKYLHRYIMEQHIGRELESYEIVHHDDENTLNNDIKNLKLTSPSGHCKIHIKKRGASPKFTRKLPDGVWSIKYEKCISCNSTKIKHHSKGLCKNCYQQEFRKTDRGLIVKH